MYDVVIVGAGPAGATLARLIGRDQRVLLVDRRRFDLDRGVGPVKLCGGLLAPAAQKELARQGLGVPSSVTAGPQLFAVRTLDRDSGLERLYQRFYVNVDREAFDRWLLSLVPDNVERGFGWTATHVDTSEEVPLVAFETASGARVKVAARLVVGADGATSAIRRLGLGSLPTPPRYVCVQAECEGACDDHYGAVFDRSLTDYYGWTIPKGGTTLAGAAFPAGPGVPERFERLLERLRVAGLVRGTEISRASCAVSRPSSPWQLVGGVGSVALLGEAAGLISPSSAEGISYALRSAAALAHALELGVDGAVERYRSAARPLAVEVTGKIVKSAVIHGPAARALVMRSGIGAIPQGRFDGVSGSVGELLAP